MMTEAHLADERRRFALEVVQRLREAGHEALWAGGCVRDLLLDRAPTDYDVATSAHPEQVRQLFGYRRTLAVGAAFGVIIVIGPNSLAGQVEVATFRNDAQYSDGRRPDAVIFSTAREDAARRDFTINGMFYDPLTETVCDYVEGQADLQRGLIRAIGDADARIGEDKLRMLRAVRFAARFNFAIEAATEAALARHARDLRVVSGERMTAELAKTLVTPGREFAVRTWASTGLMEVLLPQLAARWESIAEIASALVRAIEPPRWTAALAAILWPAITQEPSAIQAALEDYKGRLKFSNDDLAQLKLALLAQGPFSQAQQLPWSQLQPLLIQPWIDGALALLQARVAAGQADNKALRHVLHCLAQPADQLNPPPLIDGAILQQLGLRPGPRFKELLGAVRTLQLDGQLHDTPAAIRWIQQQNPNTLADTQK